MRIVCQQTILMKYHALFVIFEKAAKFERTSDSLNEELPIKMTREKFQRK